MARSKKRWVYSRPKPHKSKVPESVKAEVEEKSSELIESTLKSNYIKPAPEDKRFNYVVDIYTKWHRNYFYFCAKYRSPGPNALSPYFETRFARMECVGGDEFNLSYMRHTGQWWEIYERLSLDECLEAIQRDPLFMADYPLLVDQLLTVAAKAWDSQMEACVNCPTRCISEK